MKIVTCQGSRTPSDVAWCAYDDENFFGDNEDIIGWGATQDAAISDLLRQMESGESWQREEALEYRAANGA